MITRTLAQQNALQERTVKRGLFFHCDALDPDTGDPSPAGFFTGTGVLEYEGRTYYGTSLFEVEPLSAGSNYTIPRMMVRLVGIDPSANALVRGSTVAQRPVDIRVGIYDSATKVLLPPLKDRFVGMVDDIEIVTPEAGGKSIIALTCRSTSRGLTIQRHSTRSDSTQHERDPNDDIYRYTNLQRERPLLFGRKSR